MRHVACLCVADGDDALVEGTLCDPTGRSVATFVCSVRTGADGLIDRFLAFACAGARDPLPTDVDHEPADASAVVGDYFADLDGGRFADAAARFSADVLYSHPPYQHTGIDDPGRIEFRGRPALLAAFERRGTAGFDHLVITSIQRGPHCMFEGAVRGLPGGEYRQLHLQPVTRRRRHDPPVRQLLLRAGDPAAGVTTPQRRGVRASATARSARR